MAGEKTYQQGVIDGIALWGRACGSQGNCDICPIGSIRGAGVTCQDFAKQFPAKMTSILKEMDEGQVTYYEEFCLRFPSCQMEVEALALTTCRKTVFEGKVDCDKMGDEGVCRSCWLEPYISDVTESEEEAAGGSFLS